MKNIKILFLLFVVITYGQENKIKLHSGDVGFGFFLNRINILEPNDGNTGGLNLNINFTVKYNKHLSNIGFIGGEELSFWGKPNYNFSVLKLQYGRRLDIAKWLKLEGFIGISHLNQKRKDFSYNELAYPISLKTIFKISPSGGVNINTNYILREYERNLVFNIGYYYQFN